MAFDNNNTSCSPFAGKNPFPFDISEMKWIEVGSDNKLYQLLLSHIASHRTSSVPIQSFAPKIKDASSRSSCCGGCCDGAIPQRDRVDLVIGLGHFSFCDEEGRTLHAIHQVNGDPVGLSYEVGWLRNLIVLTDHSEEDLKRFLSYLIVQSEKTEAGTFSVYNWKIRCEYWSHQSSTKARPISSVILPDKSKSRLLTDIDSFLSEETKAFYDLHGIPYRRSYLFYGVPGAGKTSMIQALAGHYQRSVSYIHLSDPELTDESLKKAINKLVDDTIVVFEDIDALFARDRSNKVSKSNLTFSGLLNALDGVGGGNNGQIFILTTNLRDQLDPALIRKGRVDIHVEFNFVTNEQISGMWRSFYPDAADLSEEFARRLRASLGEREIAAATLQHYFVLNMRSSATEAMENVHWVLEDLLEQASEVLSAHVEEKKSEKKKRPNAKATEEESGNETDGEDETKSNESDSKKTMPKHFHFHFRDKTSSVEGLTDLLTIISK